MRVRDLIKLLECQNQDLIVVAKDSEDSLREVSDNGTSTDVFESITGFYDESDKFVNKDCLLIYP